MSLDTVLLPSSADGVVRLLQISDTHLFADKNRDLLGVNTWRSFQAVVDGVRQSHEPCELIVATGDLSQDHSSQSYEHFIDGVQTLGRPLYWLPGNHDDSLEMARVMAQRGISPIKILVSDHWLMVLLDTQVAGRPGGHLSAQQFGFLRQALEAYPDKHCLVLLHHNILPTGSRWLDQHKVDNGEQILAFNQQYPRIRGFLCGHIHQHFEQRIDGVSFIASPSTCIQFKPHSDEFSLDVLSPGWRFVQLHPDGRIAGQVWRLPPGLFTPDFSASGY